MKTTSAPLTALQAQHRRLAQQLSQTAFICQGSVFARKKGSLGSRYQWTWKNPKQKTISLTLSSQQFAWLKKAVATQRKLEQTIKKMQQVSHRILVGHLPGPSRRKPLSMKQLGLI